MNVVIPAAETGAPSLATASSPLSPLLWKCDFVKASARWRIKSTESPTRMVMETASTIPSVQPAIVKIARTLAMIVTRHTSARRATTALPVKMITDPTANAVDMAMALTVPLTAASSVAIRTNISPVNRTLGCAHTFAGHRYSPTSAVVRLRRKARLSTSALKSSRKSFHLPYQSPMTLLGWFHGTVVFTLTFRYPKRTSVTAPRLYVWPSIKPTLSLSDTRACMKSLAALSKTAGGENGNNPYVSRLLSTLAHALSDSMKHGSTSITKLVVRLRRSHSSTAASWNLIELASKR